MHHKNENTTLRERTNPEWMMQKIRPALKDGLSSVLPSPAPRSYMLYTSAVLYLERAELHVKKKKLLILILNISLCRWFRFCEPSTRTKEDRMPRSTSASCQSPAPPSTSPSGNQEVAPVGSGKTHDISHASLLCAGEHI